MDRKDLQELSRTRLREAKALLSLGLFDGAYYLAGYAVECSLKACIAKATKRYEWPDKKRAQSIHTHKIGDLLALANLDVARRERSKQDSKFRENWEVVQSWSEESRYHTHREETARTLVDAIDSRGHGVFEWVKRYW